MSASPLSIAEGHHAWARARERFGATRPETGDAVLYALSALFALITIVGSSLALYRQWAELAIGPFLFGSVVSGILAVVARRRSHRTSAKPDNRSVTRGDSSPRGQWIARIAIATASSPVPRRSRSGSRSSGVPTVTPGRTSSPRLRISSGAGRRSSRGKTPITR